MGPGNNGFPSSDSVPDKSGPYGSGPEKSGPYGSFPASDNLGGGGGGGGMGSGTAGGPNTKRQCPGPNTGNLGPNGKEKQNKQGLIQKQTKTDKD